MDDRSRFTNLGDLDHLQRPTFGAVFTASDLFHLNHPIGKRPRFLKRRGRAAIRPQFVARVTHRNFCGPLGLLTAIWML
jgi:hypothetical protein